MQHYYTSASKLSLILTGHSEEREKFQHADEFPNSDFMQSRLRNLDGLQNHTKDLFSNLTTVVRDG